MNQSEVINLIKNDISIQNYFFHKLSNTKTPERWFDELKKTNFYNSVYHPHAIRIKENNRTSYRSDYWPILGYFENLSRKNFELKNLEISTFFKKFISEVNSKQKAQSKEISFRNFRTDISLIDIMAFIPPEHLDTKVLENLSDLLGNATGGSEITLINHLIPNILQYGTQELIKELMNQVLSYRMTESDKIWGEGKEYRFNSILTDYWLNKIIKSKRITLIENYSELIYEICLNKIKEIIEIDKSQFVWFKLDYIGDDHISEHNLSTEYHDIISDLFRDAIKTLNLERKHEVIKEMFELADNQNHEYFDKIAIYLISLNYEDLRTLFWERYKAKESILYYAELKREIYELIAKNAATLSNDELDIVITWIEAINEDYFTEESKKRGSEWLQQMIAYKKLEWYEHALAKSNFPEIKEKVFELKNLCDWERKDILPGHWKGETKGGFISHSSPEDAKLNEKSIEEVADYLIHYGEVFHPDHVKSSSEGLARELKEDVRQRPLEYSQNIEAFTSIKVLYYWEYLYWGFREAIQDGKQIEWESLLKFGLEKIQEPSFFDTLHEKNNTNSYKQSFLRFFVDTIEEGFRSKEKELSLDSLNLVSDTLLFLLEQNPYKDEPIEHRRLNHISQENIPVISNNEYYNTIPGKIYRALVIAIWRIEKEIQNKKYNEENKLFKWLKNQIDKGIDSEVFYYALGVGYRGYWYYQKQWCLDNKENIFPSGQPQKLLSVFSGFLENVPNVFEDIFQYFHEQGIWDLAIQHIKDFNDWPKESLCHQILLGSIYVNGKENTEFPLIKKLLNTGDPLVLEKSAWMTWKYLNDGATEANKIVVPVWQTINNNIKNFEKKEKNRIIGYFGYLAKEVNGWSDEIKKCILETIELLDEDYDTYHLLDAFEKHFDLSPKFVIEVFERLTKRKIFFRYQHENVNSLVERIYNFNDGEYKDKANFICNFYGENGLYFLKEIWERHNPEIE